MHDTSSPGVFAKERRDLSHGCIRVERPEDLAEWALRGQAGWPRERNRVAMHGKESVFVKLTRPIQLVTTYVTAVVATDGEVRFLPDIYGQDAALEKEHVAQERVAHLPASSVSR